MQFSFFVARKVNYGGYGSGGGVGSERDKRALRLLLLLLLPELSFIGIGPVLRMLGCFLTNYWTSSIFNTVAVAVALSFLSFSFLLKVS